MPRLQQKVCFGAAHFRAWNNQSCLSEVQKRQGEAEHLSLYHKDQPEELRADRSSPVHVFPFRRSSSPEKPRTPVSGTGRFRAPPFTILL
jgi:hypothetical protein